MKPIVLAILVLASPPERRTTDDNLGIVVEKLRLDNGMIVLLSRDPTVDGVLVDVTYRAGTVYEPPKKSGLAHLIEHVLVKGKTPRTDYWALLEGRGARYVGAFTTPSTMNFRSIVPPHELPLALWVQADRMVTVLKELTPAELTRHKRVVEVERLQQHIDRPYGAVEIAIFRKLFPSPHPLNSAVIGRKEELASVTVDDVGAWVSQHIHPANAVLTIVGRFESSVAKAWIERTVARIPPGEAPAYPELPGARFPNDTVVAFPERLSRRPRVSMFWRLPELPERVSRRGPPEIPYDRRGPPTLLRDRAGRDRSKPPVLLRRPGWARIASVSARANPR